MPMVEYAIKRDQIAWLLDYITFFLNFHLKNKLEKYYIQAWTLIERSLTKWAKIKTHYW